MVTVFVVWLLSKENLQANGKSIDSDFRVQSQEDWTITLALALCSRWSNRSRGHGQKICIHRKNNPVMVVVSQLQSIYHKLEALISKICPRPARVYIIIALLS